MTEETAIINVKPDANEAVIALYQEAIALEVRAVKIVIATDEDVKSVTNDLSVIAGLKKAIEEKRKEYTQPINDHLKAVNEAFKNFTEPLNVADKSIRYKVLEYRHEQERIRQEQERINQLRIEAARAEMELKGELTESVELVEERPEQPQHYWAEAGELGTVTIWKFEVIDFSLLPDQYKLPDMVKIRKVITAGATIPGVKAWKEETLRINTAKGG